MRAGRLLVLGLVIAALGACAAKAQVRTEVDLPPLDPPPPPPRVVAVYAEPEPELVSPPVDAAVPVVERPTPRPRPEARAGTTVSAAEAPTAAPPTASLTLTPTPGSEPQTVAAIRALMARAARDLGRVNTAALNRDGRSQFDTARRFLEQADEALKASNIVFAGKLADKAATMAAILVR
jgi:hypothetical protein